jgi:hypothetical protein
MRGRDFDEDEDVGPVRETVHRWVEGLTSYARSRPLEGLMAAFILGMLVMLLGRKER